MLEEHVDSDSSANSIVAHLSHQGGFAFELEVAWRQEYEPTEQEILDYSEWPRPWPTPFPASL